MDSSAFDIAISTLEKEISRLESSIDGLDRWLWVSSAAVAVGVVCEIAFLIHEYFVGRDEWVRGTIKSPSRPSLRLLLLEICSVVLVVAGIIGELWVGIVSANRNTDLRSKNTRLVSLIRQKAADAAVEAGKANQRAEELKAENLTLEAKIQPRTLTLDQQRGVGDLLRRYAGHHVIVSWVTTDPEAYNFARQIVAALKYAHLDILPFTGSVNGRTYGFASETGVQVKWPPTQKDLGLALGDSLKNIGRVRNLIVVPGDPYFSVMPTDLVPVTVGISVASKPFDILH